MAVSDATGVATRSVPTGPRRLLSDERLARLAAAGDTAAFEAIFARHHQAVYRYCRAIVGSEQDAEDALQSTMAAALRALPGESRSVALKPWLFRVAHNEAISILRRRESPLSETDPVDRAVAGVDVETESRHRLRQLVADLRSLPDRQRSALVMREMSGLDYDSIAAALESTPAAARQTVYEARVALTELKEGRDMDCEAARLAISQRDGRIMRGRRIRAHLRGCEACRDFKAGISTRQADLAALCPPLPALVASGIIAGILGGSGGGGAGGAAISGAAAAGAKGAGAAGAGAAAGGGGGGIGGLLGASAGVKAASVVAAAAIGAGAAQATGVVDLPGLGGSSGSPSNLVPVAPSTHHAGAGAAAAGTAGAASRSAHGSAAGARHGRHAGQGRVNRGHGRGHGRAEGHGSQGQGRALGNSHGVTSSGPPTASGSGGTQTGNGAGNAYGHSHSNAGGSSTGISHRSASSNAGGNSASHAASSGHSTHPPSSPPGQTKPPQVQTPPPKPAPPPPHTPPGQGGTTGGGAGGGGGGSSGGSK